MHRNGAAPLEMLLASLILGAMACPLSHGVAVAQAGGSSGEQAESQFVVYRLDPITNERALPDCFPDVPGTAGGALSLAGCRDEYESASFAIYARQDLHSVRLELGDLRSGDRVLPKSSFEAWVVKCWY